MKTRTSVVYVFWLTITIIPILGLIWSVVSPKDFAYWQTLSRDWFSRFGSVAPLVFVLLQAMQVILTPVSHYTVGAIGGYLYGPYLGGILNYIGRVIGHCIAFMIARKLGRRLMIKYLQPNTVKTYDRIFAGTGNGTTQGFLQPFILFLIYFLPLFPDDEMSYLVGMSKMNRKAFILANVFGQLGGAFSLAYLGSGIDTKDALFWILTVSTLLGFPIIWVALKVQQDRHNRPDTRKPIT